MASHVLPVIFLFFFPSRGLFMRLVFFGRLTFLGVAYGGQYLIAAFYSVHLNVSISKWQVSFVSGGYWLCQHSVVHQTSMEFVAVKPSILDNLTTATMWWQGIPSVYGVPQEQLPNIDPPFGSFRKKQFLLVCPCSFLVTLQSHNVSSSVILMLWWQKLIFSNAASHNVLP